MGVILSGKLFGAGSASIGIVDVLAMFCLLEIAVTLSVVVVYSLRADLARVFVYTKVVVMMMVFSLYEYVKVRL